MTGRASHALRRDLADRSPGVRIDPRGDALMVRRLLATGGFPRIAFRPGERAALLDWRGEPWRPVAAPPSADAPGEGLPRERAGRPNGSYGMRAGSGRHLVLTALGGGAQTAEAVRKAVGSEDPRRVSRLLRLLAEGGFAVRSAAPRGGAGYFWSASDKGAAELKRLGAQASAGGTILHPEQAGGAASKVAA